MTKSAGKRNGIVLAMFGTSVEHALPGLLHIRDRVIARFPQTTVRVAFTSKIIRRIWQKRASDPGYRAVHPEVPEDILEVQGTEAVILDMQEEGVDTFVVQPVLIAPAREHPEIDFSASEPGATAAPISRIVFGRPALGGYGMAYPSADDIVIAARSLSGDAALASREKAALLYMGHGNRKHSTALVYGELVAEMRRQYPDIITVMTLVEENPSVDEIVAELKGRCVTKILLKPLMVVAGDHVSKDMVGGESGNLKTRFEEKGFTVVPIFKGLGEDDAFADIFVQHAADAACEAGIELK